MIKKSLELNSKIFKKYNLFLFYGKNEDLKKEKISEITANTVKTNLYKYDENEILNDEDIFFNQILNKSLFENEKIFVVNRVSDKIYQLIQKILEKNIDDKIILNASILDKKSKLRNLFEKDKKLICTPVYEDDNRSLTSVLQNFLRDHKLSISQEMKNILIERSKGDRINLKNELIKLKNLSLSRSRLNAEDIIKLSNLAENYSVFELSDNYLAKNSKKVSNILNENNYSSEDCILIIRTILSKLKRLLKLRSKIDNNENINEIISSFKPPIFWKEKDIVRKQVQSWSTEEVKEMIIKINGLETLVKKNSVNSMLFVSDFVSNY